MGRKFFAFVGFMMLVVAVAGCDWATFGFDGGHTRSSGETTISTQNVGNLKAAWAGLTGATVTASPAIVGDVAYVNATNNKLYAFNGTTNCTPALKTCNPLWTANVVNNYTQSPSVADGVVYIHSGATLYAFDAKGSTGCGGSPKVCAPLWTGPVPVMSGAAISGPVVADGVVYAPGSATVVAFDTKAITGCSGAPKVCAPLWSTSTGGLVAAATGGRLYVLYGYNLYTFDGAGSQSCKGIPKVCAPLWSYPTNGQTSAPAIANGIVYIGGYNGGSPRLLAAYTANGTTGCTGTPKVCSPLWTSTVPGGNATDSAPAVINGVVFIGSFDSNVYAFRATADATCTGTVKSCPPLWTGATNGFVHSSPAVSNGAVYVGSNDKSLYVFR